MVGMADSEESQPSLAVPGGTKQLIILDVHIHALYGLDVAPQAYGAQFAGAHECMQFHWHDWSPARTGRARQCKKLGVPVVGF